MDKARILIVEDDDELRQLIRKALVDYGFRADSIENGQDLPQKISQGAYDLVLLDLMLPGEDGLSLCRKLRDSSQNCPTTPIIVISALGDIADRIVGLEMGADDYLPKPFAMRELVARIKAVLRRTEKSPPTIAANSASGKNASSTRIVFAGWTLDLLSHCLLNASGVAIALSRTEFSLLSLLCRHPGQILHRERIIASLGNEDVCDRSVDVQINRLRNKLGDTDKNNPIIKTVRGEGYMFMACIAAGKDDVQILAR